MKIKEILVYKINFINIKMYICKIYKKLKKYDQGWVENFK